MPRIDRRNVTLLVLFLLIAGTLGVVVAWLTAHLLNRFRLSRFFSSPPLVFLALSVIYTGLIGTFLIRV
mgnify:CR=1 FL=1